MSDQKPPEIPIMAKVGYMLVRVTFGPDQTKIEIGSAHAGITQKTIPYLDPTKRLYSLGPNPPKSKGAQPDFTLDCAQCHIAIESHGADIYVILRANKGYEFMDKDSTIPTSYTAYMQPTEEAPK